MGVADLHACCLLDAEPLVAPNTRLGTHIGARSSVTQGLLWPRIEGGVPCRWEAVSVNNPRGGMGDEPSEMHVETSEKS